MKIILQRVRSASVEIGGVRVGAIGQGVLLLVGFGEGDDQSKFQPLAEKIAVMRIFPNAAGRFDRSLVDIGGSVLLVPQFTLFADTSKGRRPDFFGALKPELAAALFEQLITVFEQILPARIAAGKFGADMLVSLENDGPVTIPIDF